MEPALILAICLWVGVLLLIRIPKQLRAHARKETNRWPK